MATLYRNWQQREQHFLQRQTSQDELEARQQLLQFQLDEFEKIDLQENELEGLEQEQNQLSNAELYLTQAHQALALSCEGDTNLLTMINTAIGSLSGLESENTHMNEAQTMFNDAQIQIEEAGRSLRAFIEHFEIDPERLQWIEERLSAIYQLARKHQCQPVELVQVHSRLHEELNSLSCEQDLESLENEVSQLKQQFLEEATKLRKQRQATTKELEKDIAKQLKLLDMQGVKFKVSMEAFDERRMNQNGLDEIEFLVSTNAGQPAKALRKVASGGELSRISLAIQVVIAQRSAIPTLVFDEVDVGIGGGTAQIVGKLLRELGGKGQVICVTHQAQVASQGHHHYFISKREQNKTVRSSIDLLNTDQRVQEVARMLGGIDMTEQTLAHAEEMLGACT